MSKTFLNNITNRYLQNLEYVFYNINKERSNSMENLKVVKIVDKDKTYTDSKGKQRCSVNYYLVIDNTYIAIRPCFAKGYTQIDMISELRVNGGLGNNENPNL